MSAKVLLEYVLTCDAGLLFLALVLMLRCRAHRDLPFFAGVLGVSTLHFTLDVALLFHRKEIGLSLDEAFRVFCYTGWVAQTVASIFIVLSIYNIYRLLMSPLHGLHHIGKVLFRWVAGVAACLACIVVFGPHPTGTNLYSTLCGQVQEGVAILTLCLLLAVSFATRPLGLTFRSRVFGVCLGLGLLAVTDLVQAAWLTTSGARSVYSPIYLVTAFGCLAAVVIWATYFARPEPVRKMITLPTTSPFFFWNRIAEALGDAPGEVAVGGVSPEMFTPAELVAFSSPPRQPVPAPVPVVVEMPRAVQR